MVVCAVLWPLALSAAGPVRLALDSPTLTAAEKYVFAQVLAGKPADLEAKFPEGTNRVLRAAFLEALLTQNSTNIHRNGFVIAHAVVPDALDLRNAEVRYEISLTQCRFEGDVDFTKCVFEKGFSVAGSSFARSARFYASRMKSVGNFDQASFDADVSAAQMEVIGVLSAQGARFNSATGLVDFTSLKTADDVVFHRALFAGPVTFQSARILGNWRFDGSQFTNTRALINFEEASVGASTTFSTGQFAGYISFKDGRFAGLDFKKTIWPARADDHAWLWFNGLTYTRISAGEEKDSWRNLLQLVQRSARGSAYSGDVFTQLEDYYRRLGYPGPANAFYTARKQREREEVLTGFAWAWSFFLQQFVGFGRSPERAIFWSVVVVGFGCLMFQPHRMEPQKPEFVGRKYSAFWYSVDVYLPIIKLHDADIWKPKEEYVLTHIWRRIHTVLGWALIPIAIATWTSMSGH